MSDWTLTPIKKMGRVVTGKTPPKSNPDYFDGDILFVSPKDLDWDSTYITSTQTKITEKALEKFRNQVLPKNAVMYTSLSFGFGKIGIASQTLLTNQQINSIITNKNHYYRFIYYLLRANRPVIFSYNSGIDTPIVPKSVFEKIKLPCPPLPVQKKITAVLSAYDDLIENNNKRIALLEKAAEEIYREWFVRLRFPGWENTHFQKGIPENWGISTFSKVCNKITSGGTPRTSEPLYWDGDIPWLSSGETRNSFVTTTEKTITPLGVENSSTRLAKSGSVVIASAGQGNTRGQTSLLLIDTYINQSVLNLSSKIVSNYFLFFNISSRYQELRLASDAFSSRGSLTTKLIGKLELLVPPKGIISQFDSIVEPIIKQIKTSQLAIDNLQLQRDMLLSRLISGKFPVDDLDIQFPPSMMASQEPAHA